MNTQRLKNILPKNEWVNQEIKEEIKSTLKPMKVKTQQSKTSVMQKGDQKGDAYGNPGLPKDGRKVSNTQPKLTPKGAGKRSNKAQN